MSCSGDLFFLMLLPVFFSLVHTNKGTHAVHFPANSFTIFHCSTGGLVNHQEKQQCARKGRSVEQAIKTVLELKYL